MRWWLIPLAVVWVGLLPLGPALVVDLELDVLIRGNAPLTFWLWYTAWLVVGLGVSAAILRRKLADAVPVIVWLFVGGLSFLFIGRWPVWFVLVWWWAGAGPIAYLVERLQRRHRRT